ncbi:hypothetical protein T439DRAFT_382693 [Meredithblackwellia eburnea MCA 4105]
MDYDEGLMDLDIWSEYSPSDEDDAMSIPFEANANVPANLIPVETLDKIFDLALDSGHGLVDYLFLLRASLVCRRWRGSAQRILGLRLWFDQYTPLRIIRWLSISPGGIFNPFYLSLHRLSKNPAIEVLNSCPRLTTLRVHDVSLGDWSIFRIPGLSGLKDLEIAYNSVDADPSDTSPLSLPLEILKINGEKIPRLSDRHDPALHFFRALLAGASRTLRSVELEWCLTSAVEIVPHLTDSTFGPPLLITETVLPTSGNLHALEFRLAPLEFGYSARLGMVFTFERVLRIVEAAPPKSIKHLSTEYFPNSWNSYATIQHFRSWRASQFNTTTASTTGK